MLIIEDINAYNLIWNFHCYIKKNIKLLKKFINNYKLIIHNNFD